MVRPRASCWASAPGAKTFIGKAILAVSQDPLALRLVGGNPVKVKEVAFGLSIATAIIAEASLSFLGLGQQPPAPSWGPMLNTAKNYMDSAPWMSISPGIAIVLVVLGFNLLGDGLRDALDPREQ